MKKKPLIFAVFLLLCFVVPFIFFDLATKQGSNENIFQESKVAQVNGRIINGQNYKTLYQKFCTIAIIFGQINFNDLPDPNDDFFKQNILQQEYVIKELGIKKQINSLSNEEYINLVKNLPSFKQLKKLNVKELIPIFENALGISVKNFDLAIKEQLLVEKKLSDFKSTLTDKEIEEGFIKEHSTYNLAYKVFPVNKYKELFLKKQFAENKQAFKNQPFNSNKLIEHIYSKKSPK